MLFTVLAERQTSTTLARGAPVDPYNKSKDTGIVIVYTTMIYIK